jgi:hemerythrin-like domain-containing protein
MAVQIGAKPDAGFDNPIGMMKDCHRRVERFLDILHQVARHAHGRTLNPGEVAGINSALVYFRTSGPRHSRDEEDSLFPRLRAASGSNPLASQLLKEIARLEADHQQAAQLHQEADELYTRWISDGLLGTQHAAQLEFVTGELARIYSTHIAVEEGLIFPRASELFTRKQLDEMSREFRQRRDLE